MRAAEMGAAEAPVETTTMVSVCPATAGEVTQADAPTPAIAALAATAPCKWRPAAGAELGRLPPVGRQTLVLIDSVAYRLRRARWMVRPDTP